MTEERSRDAGAVRGRCARHPEREAVAGCRICGDFLCEECRDAGRDGMCARCAGLDAPAGEADAWERKPGLGRFFRVIGALVAHPKDFFAELPRRGGAWTAYLHAVGVLVLSAAAATLINYLVGPAAGGAAARAAWLRTLWLVPVNLAGLAVVVLLDALICYALANFYDKGVGLGAVLRVVSYATAAYVFYPLPTLGLPIAVILSLVYVGYGARHALGLDAVRAVTVALLPLLLRAAAVFILAGDRLSAVFA
jgi:hypothetical protein